MVKSEKSKLKIKNDFRRKFRSLKTFFVTGLQ